MRVIKLKKRDVISIVLCIIIIINFGFSESSEAKTKVKLATPTLTSCNAYDNSICITWNGVKKADGYQIFRKTSGGKYKRIATVKKSCRKYYDVDIIPGEKYTYTVRAYDKRKSKIYYSKYLKSGISVFNEPVISSIKLNGKTATLYWKKCSGAQGYKIYYRKSVNGKWKALAKTTKTKYTIKNFNALNYYTVRAYKKIGKTNVMSTYDKKFSAKYRTANSKKIIFDGGSTVYGSLKNGSRAEFTFPQRVGLLTGAQCINLGYPGTTVAMSSSGKSISNNILMEPDRYQGADIVCINVGTNDYKYFKNIGSEYDIKKIVEIEERIKQQKQTGVLDLFELMLITRERKELLNSYYGALSYIVYCIRENNNEADIILMTPQFCGKYGSEKDINAYIYKNKAGYTLNDYADAVKKVAEYYNVYLYDAQRADVVNYKNYKTSTVDYIHSTQETYIKLGDSITEYMKRNNII